MLRFLPAYTAFVNSLSNLVARLDAAVRLDNPKDITRQVKLDLEAAINDGQVVLPERFLQTRPEGYARRLLYRSEELGYTAVVMTWAAGQRTPLHDHAGIWCVEGVVSGQMSVTRFDLETSDGDRCRFMKVEEVQAGEQIEPVTEGESVPVPTGEDPAKEGAEETERSAAALGDPTRGEKEEA